MASKALREAALKLLHKSRWKTNEEILPEVRALLGQPTLNKRQLSDAVGDLIREGKAEFQRMGFSIDAGAPRRYRKLSS